MIRVVLADDHPFVRSGIRNILNKTADITVVGEAGDGFQALRLVAELAPDVLILDMEMPGLKGYEVARRLQTTGSRLPVLALSAHEDKQFIVGMLGQGAFGYLTKDEVPDTIVKAVRGVARGEKGWISRRVAARIALWLKAEKPGEMNFSEEEIEILKQLLNGKSSQQIGNILNIDESTVERLIEQIVVLMRESLEENLSLL